MSTLLGALVLETASLACFSGLTVSLLGRARRPRFFTLLRIDVTVYGFSRVLPAAAATGGALRLRLLTAAGVTHPDALFLATIEGTGSALLLLWVMLGATLVVALPVNGADPPRLAAAVAWGAANWVLDATVLWGVLAAVGHPLNPLTLFTAYAVANVLGLLPITPGGVGVVEGVLVPSLVAAGVTAPGAGGRAGVAAGELLAADPGRRAAVAHPAPPPGPPGPRR